MVLLLHDWSYFLFNNTYYKQETGMAMGSPLSPTVAKICMEYIIDTARQKIKNQIRIDLKDLYIFVDDIFCTIPSMHLDYIVNTFNSIHHKIQFTFEKEVDGALSYLDMKIIKKQNKVITNWYHKPYASNRLLNYNSEHSLQQKISTISNLKHRIFTLSDNTFRHENTQRFREICQQNNYPKHLINKILFKTLPHRTSESTHQQPAFYRFPFLFPLSIKIKKNC